VWELADEDSRRRAAASEAWFQKRIEGQHASVIFSLGDVWTTTLGMTAQWVGASAARAAKFQYAGSYAIGQTIPPAIQEQIKSLAHVLANQFQLRGLVGVDLVLDSQRAWIVEINPRYTASVEVIERNSGVSAIEAHVAACQGTLCTERGLDCEKKENPADPSHGKAILYAKQEVVINAVFFTWAMTQAGYGLDSRLADIPELGSRIPSGRPVLTLFASAPTAEIEQRLCQRIAEVETQLYR